jgi:gluconolactonase
MADKPEKIAGGYGATAGPVFSRRGYLLFSDTESNRILKWERGSVSVFREKSNGASGNTFDHQGRLLTCEKDRVTRTEKDGAITVLAPELKAPNDLVYAIDGSIYVSDPLAGTVYQITRAGKVRPAARDSKQPSGVALAPNQQRLFVADAATNAVRVYDIAGDGALSGGRVFAEMTDRPGGLKTAEDGSVWVAGGSSVWRFDTAGKHIETTAVSERATSCNWGEGFHDLYVTAGGSIYRVRAAVNGTRTY